MQTIVVVLDPSKLKNPDADLCYKVPEQIEKFSKGAILDNGYDYIEHGRKILMGIWLETEDAAEGWKIVLQLFQKRPILRNDLSFSAEIYISEQDTAELQDCVKVFPQEKDCV